nr:hypothetical protein [uncultured bacterium]
MRCRMAANTHIMTVSPAESARSRSMPLATADRHLLDVCHAEGIAVVVIPAAKGFPLVADGS